MALEGSPRVDGYVGALRTWGHISANDGGEVTILRLQVHQQFLVHKGMVVMEETTWNGRDSLVAKSLENTFGSAEVKLMIRNTKGLHEIWSTPDVCY